MNFLQSKSFNYLLLFFFLVLLGISKYYHEPWRDEFHSLCISLAAKNPVNLFTLRGYEGHPYIYYFILYLTQLFGKSYLAFILVHYVSTAITMYLVLFKFQLHWFTKLLLPFNYYLLFEFGTLNRQYIFVLMLLVLSVYFFLQDKPKLYASLFCIAIAAHIHLQALPICFGLGMCFIAQQFFNQKISLSISLLLGASLMAVIFLSYYTCIPPSDCFNRVHEFIPDIVGNFLSVIKKVNYGNLTLFNWNDFYFWNEPLFQNGMPHILLFILFTIGSVYFLAKPFRLFYLIALSGIFYMLFILNTWGFRHFSFAWIAFFIFYLLSSTQQRKWSTAFILIWLIPQAVSGSIACYRDIKYPFSNCGETAKVLETLKSPVPIAGYLNYTLDGLTYVTGKPMYYLGTEHLETYTKFVDGSDFEIMEVDRFMKAVNIYLQKYKNGYLVINNSNPTTNFRSLLLSSTTFTGKIIYSSSTESIIPDESYEIYKIERK